MSSRQQPMRIPDPHEILTTEELAAWMKKSPRTIERMRFPTVAPGRYLFRHVLEQLDRQKRRKGKAA